MAAEKKPAVKKEAAPKPKAPECKHVWIGSTDGVTCKKCEIHLTHDEYVKFLKKKNG